MYNLGLGHKHWCQLALDQTSSNNFFLKTWGIKTLHLLLHSWLSTLYVREAMLLLQHSGHKPEAYSLVHWPLPSVEEHRQTMNHSQKLQLCLIHTQHNTTEHRLLNLQAMAFSLTICSIDDNPPILLCCWLPMQRCCITVTHTKRHKAEACMSHAPSVWISQLFCMWVCPATSETYRLQQHRWERNNYQQSDRTNGWIAAPKTVKALRTPLQWHCNAHHFCFVVPDSLHLVPHVDNQGYTSCIVSAVVGLQLDTQTQ